MHAKLGADDTPDMNQTQTPKIDHAIQIQNVIQRLHETHQKMESMMPQLSEQRPNELRQRLTKIQAKFEESKDQCEQLKSAIDEHKHQRLAKKDIKAARKNNIAGLRKIMQYKLDEKLARHKFMLEKLNLIYRAKFTDSYWNFEFIYNDNKIMFRYDNNLDRFELTNMIPKVSTFDQICNLLSTTNDICATLCAWRSFNAKLYSATN